MTDSRTRQLHEQADLLLNSNRLMEARAVYDQICSIDSSDPEAFLMRGALDGEMGKVDAAMQSLNEAIRIDPEYADAYHTLAHVQQHQGKLEEAREALQKAVEIDPELTEAWAMLSGLLGQLAEFAGAESASRRALELDPTLTDARANLATALVEQGKNEEAVPELRRVVEQQPASAHVWSRLGAILARLEQYQEAIPALETALRLNASDNEARTALAYAYYGDKAFANAREQLQQIIEINPSDDQAWATLVSATEDGGWQDLAEFCERLMQRFPDNRRIILNHGYALEMLNDLDGASADYQQVTREFPEWGEGWNRLGLLYMRREEPHQAAASLKKALDCGIDSPMTLCMYGAAVRTHGSFIEAEHYCKLAMEKAPDLIPVYIHLGMVQTMMGKLDQAMETFSKGRELDADNLLLVAGVADALERQGNAEQAFEILEPYLDSDQEGIAVITCTLAKISNKLDLEERALGLVEKILARETILRASAMDLHFRAADIYHNLRAYDKAIDHYHQANALSELEFDREAHIQFVSDVIASFNRDTLDHLTDLGNPSSRPVFIVGMPRSGTSLAEQILASHPDVFGAGELMDFPAVEYGLGFDNKDASGYTARLASLTAAETHRYAEAYLNSINALSDGERYVTDKLPYNFLRLGLIQILFPNARVIHTRRDPMDSCLSCYFLDFMGTHPHAYDLENLGIYYRQYERLMAHWHDVLSLPILDLQYEEAVDDIEATCRRLADFCELDWDDRMLNFHQSNRVVKTASYDQVRRPVYKSSVGRWRPYGAWLDPLKRGLSLP